MRNLNGYIKIHRKMLNWGWYADPVVRGVFLHLLLIANFRENKWMGRTLDRGQIVTSYANLAKETGFSVRQARTALEKLKSTGEVTSKATNKYTIITIENWDKYQCIDEDIDKQIGTQMTSERQTNDKPATNERQQIKNKRNKEIKNKRNIKKEIKKEPSPKHKYGEYKNVLLTDEEMEKLMTLFPHDYMQRIERLSEYIASSGKSYKNHLATIRSWARKEKAREDAPRERVIQMDGELTIDDF